MRARDHVLCRLGAERPDRGEPVDERCPSFRILYIGKNARASNRRRIRSGKEVPNIVIPMGTGIAGIVGETHALINVKNAYDDERFDVQTDKLTGFSTRQILCAPVLDNDTTVSVIEALNKNDDSAFDDEDIFILRTICQELRSPLRRAAADEAFKQRAAATDSEFGYLQQFTAVASRRQSVEPQSARYHEEIGREDGLATFDWDVLALDDAALLKTIGVMFTHHASLARHDCDERKFQSFIRAVQKSYNGNAYHNFQHGVFVLHICFVGVCRTSRTKGLTSLDLLALKVAALAHDIDHPGWNNDFEVNSASDKALLYNDASVLENHHAAYLYKEILRKKEHNFLDKLPADAYRECRKVIIAAILATDMSFHGMHVDELRRFADRNAGKKESESPPHDRRQFYVNTLIHLGDMAAQTLPNFEASKKWGYRIVEEFQNQAAQEGKLGLPVSPFMAKLSTEVDVAMSQVAFIDYVVGPLITVIIKIFPELEELEGNAKRNRDRWSERAEEASVAQEAKEQSEEKSKG